MDEISSRTAYQRSFRLFQIRPIIVIVSIISIIINIIIVCVRVCVCLSDNESIGLIQFMLFGIFVMLSCIISTLTGGIAIFMFYYFGPNIIAEHNIALKKPHNRSWCDSPIESETTMYVVVSS